ncbi:MAG: sensor histidine kinase [Chloroflexota bacterium]
MSLSDIYALVNLCLANIYLVAVLILARRHWPTIRGKKYLRAVPPLTSLIYIFLAIAYGLVLFVPSERDTIGRAALRPTLPLVQTAIFAIVWLAVFEAEQLRVARLDLQRSERERLAEREEYLQFKERLIEEREDFVGIVLHEINTPLTLLNGYVGMMAEAAELAQAQEIAGEIRRTAGRFFVMKTMFDARLHRLHISAFDLCDAAARAIGDPYLYVATRKMLGEIPIAFTCSGPIIVEADFEKIRVAIWELIRNALKATEADGETAVRRGVKRAAENGRITVEVTAENGHAIVIVEDNGIGIPESYRPRIFEPGSQLFESMMARRNEGAGYGLYTVNHIMNEHHGAVALDWTAEGEGSRFVLYLPRR